MKLKQFNKKMHLRTPKKITESKQNNIVQSTIDVKVFTYVSIVVTE